MPKPSAPSGFRDFLPEQFRRRTELVERIRRVYESFGFQGMDTPAMENLSVFQGKGGGENEKLMFQVLKRGADLGRALEKGGTELSDMALRFDHTVPLARYFASHRTELPAIFKRYQLGSVWRADRPQRGRYREFMQCDIDVLGSSSPMVEAEVILVTATALVQLGFSDISVRLNSRPLLGALVRSFGVPESHVNAAYVAIDKLDKVPSSEVEKELVEKGVPTEAARSMLEFEATSSSSNTLLDDVEKRVGDAGRGYLDQLRTVLAITAILPAGRLFFDPFLARGMDYYTGPVFEIVTPDAPSKSDESSAETTKGGRPRTMTLGGGGRFDGLIERLGGPSVPACGFSIGFERVFAIMEERGMFVAGQRAADLLVAVPSAEAAEFALALGSELRSQGLAVDVYPGTAKLGAQFELAERKGIPFAVVADPQASDVSIRELSTRQNTALRRPEVGAWVRQRLGSPKGTGD
jgi:histidyl-tRNA synthetase